jgi:uncharacterized membrane protein
VNTASGDVSTNSPELSDPADRGLVRAHLARSLNTWRGRVADPAWIYLLVAVPFGLLFVFLTPPSQVLDEAAHWYRVWEVTDGRVIAEVTTDQSSGLDVNVADYPRCVPGYTEYFVSVAASPEPFDSSDFWTNHADCDGPEVEVQGVAMGPYSAWSYPGQTLGVLLGRMLQLPIPAVFFIGRLAGLAVATALCWFAIRRAPRAKNLLCFVCLLPMTLILNAGYSPDGLVLGASILLISSALRFAETDTEATRLDLAAVALALTALAVTKPPYLLFGALMMVYRPDNFPPGWTRRRFFLLSMSIAICAVGVWSAVGYPRGAVEVYRPGIDPAGQVRWIITHPIEYMNVVGDTFMSPESQDFVLRGWVGAFGMFRSGVPDSPLMSGVFVYLAAGVLGALTVAEAGRKRRFESTREAAVSLIPLALFASAVVALYTSAYVAWDQVAAPRVFGVQGRYFIPILPLIGTALALRHERSDVALRPIFVGAVSTLLGLASLVKMSDYFY